LAFQVFPFFGGRWQHEIAMFIVLAISATINLSPPNSAGVKTGYDLVRIALTPTPPSHVFAPPLIT
jgi:hypothetical protein